MSVSTPNTAADRSVSGLLCLAVAAIAGGINGVLPARVSLFVCVFCLIVACDKPSEPRLPVSQLTLSQPCDLQQGCQAADASTAVTVTLSTEARALQPFPVHIQFEGDQQVDSVSVAFSMQGMDMGSNRYRLSADGMGGWHGAITLPICTSGRTDWLADFDFVVAQRRLQVQVPFVLQK